MWSLLRILLCCFFPQLFKNVQPIFSLRAIHKQDVSRCGPRAGEFASPRFKNKSFLKFFQVNMWKLTLINKLKKKKRKKSLIKLTNGTFTDVIRVKGAARNQSNRI